MTFNTKLFLATLISVFFKFSTSAQAPTEITQEWTSFSQPVDVLGKDGYEFRASVAIRVENIKKNSQVALWTRVDKKDGTVGFFRNDAYSTKATDKWQVFEIKGIIDDNATALNFGAFCSNNGDFYFDEFKVEIKKGSQKWQAVTLSNPGFEEDITKGDLWKNGIGRKKITLVKNFSTQYSSIKPFKGNKCLLIQGKNILGGNDIGKYVDVNGVSLYYEIYGEGEPLLMIHGNGNSMSGFIGNVEELAKHYKVIFVDCRGRGNSTYKPGVELTFDLQIEDLKQFLDKLNIEKTHIVGWSDGGILGLLMAIKHPERVNKLVSMAANIFPEGCVDLDNMKKTRDNLVEENTNHKNDLVIDLYNLDIKYPNMAYSDLSVIKAKTLIMAGDHDEIKNEHTFKIFEAIPRAQLAIAPNSTHYLPSRIQNSLTRLYWIF
jgi:pimeloyl-ACP methyl ester carboxylesterase